MLENTRRTLKKKGKYMSLALKGVSILLQQHYLICNLNYYIDAGDVVTVLGSSGSGKSSLLNFISGTLAEDFTVEGELWLDGTALHTLPAYQRQVGLQLQQHLLFPHMTVLENLLFALPAYYSKSDRINRAKQALKYCDMIEFAEANPAVLSGGQAARISLMRTLLSEPKVLLLDEPFSKLDTALRKEFRRFVFSEIESRQIPALLVTHDDQDIFDLRKVIKVG